MLAAALAPKKDWNVDLWGNPNLLRVMGSSVPQSQLPLGHVEPNIVNRTMHVAVGSALEDKRIHIISLVGLYVIVKVVHEILSLCALVSTITDLGREELCYTH